MILVWLVSIALRSGSESDRRLFFDFGAFSQPFTSSFWGSSSHQQRYSAANVVGGGLGDNFTPVLDSIILYKPTCFCVRVLNFNNSGIVVNTSIHRSHTELQQAKVYSPCALVLPVISLISFDRSGPPSINFWHLLPDRKQISSSSTRSFNDQIDLRPR